MLRAPLALFVVLYKQKQGIYNRSNYKKVKTRQKGLKVSASAHQEKNKKPEVA